MWHHFPVLPLTVTSLPFLAPLLISHTHYYDFIPTLHVPISPPTPCRFPLWSLSLAHAYAARLRQLRHLITSTMWHQKLAKRKCKGTSFHPPLILSPPQVLSYQSQVLIIARRPWRHLFIICIPTIDHRFSISQSKRMKCLKKEKVQCFQSDFLMWWWRNSQTNAFQTYIQVIIRSIFRLTFLYKDIFCINCAGLKF